MKDVALCPGCSSAQRRLLRQGNFDPTRLASQDFHITDKRYGQCWTFYRCLGCRMVYASPAPEQEDLLSFYSRLDDREYGAEAQGRAKNFRSILRRLRALRPGHGRLLDIGAANGLFVKLAREDGWQAEGLEPALSLVEEARQRFGVHLHPGTLADLPRPTQPLDVVTLLDIIEHLAEPLELLRAIHPLLRPQGLLVLVTPDIDSLAARVLGRRWWHHRIAHINFFSLPSLERLLKASGFTIIAKRRYAWHFSVLYLASRLLPTAHLPLALQGLLKKINVKVQLLDSWEIYAQKTGPLP